MPVELNAKAQLVNALIGYKLAKADGVIISQNVNFLNRGVIDDELYDDPKVDGVHLNDKGSGYLAQNTRFAICRSLNLEFVQKAKRRTPRNHRN